MLIAVCTLVDSILCLLSFGYWHMSLTLTVYEKWVMPRILEDAVTQQEKNMAEGRCACGAVGVHEPCGDRPCGDLRPQPTKPTMTIETNDGPVPFEMVEAICKSMGWSSEPTLSGDKIIIPAENGQVFIAKDGTLTVAHTKKKGATKERTDN